MTSQTSGAEGVGGRSGSTCLTENMHLDKLENKLQALEERLLRDQEEKFKLIISNLEQLNGQGGMKITEDGSQATLEKKVTDLNKKIEFLLSGENETNKVLDDLVPNLEKMGQLYQLVENKEKQDEKFKKFVIEQMKELTEDSKGFKKLLKEMDKDAAYMKKDIRDLLEVDKTSRDLVKSNNKKLDIIDRQTRSAKRRRSSGSESSVSRSSSASRSRRRGSRSRRRGRTRDTSVSSFKQKGNDFEKLLVQINDSIGVLSDKLEKSSALGVLETIVPQIASMKETLERSGSLLALPAVTKWDEDASPSPLRKRSGTPSTMCDVVSLPKSEEKSAKKSRKKRKRSRSSSSSSSSDDDYDTMDQKDLKKNIALIGVKVNKVDLKLKEMTKSWKKNATKMEENSSTVLSRVREMASGVQIIAENVDSLNDISKRLENIDDIKEMLDDLEKMPNRLKSVEDRCGDIEELVRESSAEMVNKLTRLGEEGGGKAAGRSVTTDEYDEVTSLLGRLEQENSRKFCEFGGLVETFQESIVKRLDRLHQSGGAGGGHVEPPEPPPIVPPPLPPSPSPAPGRDASVPNTDKGSSDQRTAALTIQLSQLQPRLDDLYTRVLPSLENLTSKVRKAEEKERLADREDSEHIQKILDIVEDLSEDRRSRGTKMESVERVGNPDDLRNILISQAEKLEEIYKTLFDIRDVSTTLHDTNVSVVKSESAALTSTVNKLVKLQEDGRKVLDILMKNSNSDAKTISGLNTSLQSMKASVNGVNSTTRDLKELLTGVEKKMSTLESTSVSMETKLETQIISNVGELKKSIDDGVSGVREDVKVLLDRPVPKSAPQPAAAPPPPPPPLPSDTFKVQFNKLNDDMEKLISKVTLLEVKMNIENSTKAKAVAKTETKDDGGVDRLSGELEELGKEIKSQLDDVHDMVASMEDKMSVVLNDMKKDLNVHDKHTGVSVNKIALVMRDILEQCKLISGRMPGLEAGSGSTELLARVEGLLDGLGNKYKLEDVIDLVNQVNVKQEKLGKDVGRIKLLVESDSGGGGGGGKESVRRKVKEDGVGDVGFERRMQEIRSSFEDEFNNQSDMLTEITNHIQELSDKVSTRSEDIITGINDINGLIKDLPEHNSAQSAVLEENLSAAVTAALRADQQKHFDSVTDSLFDVETKLHGIKKLLKKGGGGGADEAEDLGLKSLVDRVESVSQRLETVQTVIESGGGGGGGGRPGDGFDTSLVLTEIRKRAESANLDRHSQDVLKAIHNVQRRLLEDNKRLMNRLAGYPDQSTLQLIETFNMVRIIQSEILGKQKDGVLIQEETNRLLKSVVDCLESTQQVMDDGAGGQMTGRMADLCDELSTAVTGLISVQTSLSQSSSLEKLDGLLKTANVLFKTESEGGTKPGGDRLLDGKRRQMSGHHHHQPRRTRDSSSPASEPSSLEFLDVDTPTTTVRQPSVSLPRVSSSSVGGSLRSGTGSSSSSGSPLKRHRADGGGGGTAADTKRGKPTDGGGQHDTDSGQVADEVLTSPGTRSKM